jgi:hypothetical protein
MRSHRPPDDAATKNIEDDCNKEKSAQCRHVRDIGYPKLVGCVRRELTLDQIRRRPGIAITNGRRETLAATRTANRSIAHQTCDPFVADVNALIAKISLDTGSAVVFARLPPACFDPIAESHVCERMRRWCSRRPRIVPTRGNSERTALRGNRIFGLIALHESEDLFGTVSVSRANQAAAFDRISRSILSCLFSRRNRVNSTRSSLERPSTRRPLSRSDCLIQLRTVCRATSNSAARSSGSRPDRASSTTFCRNSSG